MVFLALLTLALSPRGEEFFLAEAEGYLGSE
jgi:hypothetical protein